MLNFPILQTKTDLLQWREDQVSQVSFVPTMGALHKGHTELIKAARGFHNKNSHSVLLSVFINPLQFGPREDFQSYPRDLKSDIKTAIESGATAIWAPTLDEVFPKGAENHFKIKVPQNLTSHLCGPFRKNHFDGVATVIVHLLKLVQPDQLILGEKDWQQLIILRNLVKDLNLPITIKGVATVRDNDGLACSSRNQYLSKKERSQCLSLQRELKKAAQDRNHGKRVDLKKISLSLELNGLEVEYLEEVDPSTLQPPTKSKHLTLLATAIRCGSTRIIDHTFLMSRKPIVAIDGPAGAGKSTVTRAFAQRMRLLYLDTGAMYRAVAWLIQNKHINPADEISVKNSLQDLTINLGLKKFSENPKIMINGNDVTDAIRSPEVTSIVSLIASQKAVRTALTNQQQEIGKTGGIVAEGRDIGTTVFPNAELKIFLTASSKERARRRLIDLQKQGLSDITLKTTENEIKKRDEMDYNRDISPLRKADDAKELITDGMTIEEVVDSLENMFRMHVPEEIWPTSKN